MNRSTSQGGERPSRQLSRTAREEREEQQAPVRKRNTRQGGERSSRHLSGTGAPPRKTL